MTESPVWYARYRDADDIERRVSTDCRDEQAARQVLNDLLAEVEKVRSGIFSPEEAHTAKYSTLLAKANVSPRKAQEPMRHSDIRLTMNLYTHIGLEDKAKAIGKLAAPEGQDVA